MSEAKHTPGPWRIGRNYGAVVADHPVHELRGSDDVNAYGGHLIAESIALQNRPLIAAAPELLQALIKLANAYAFSKPPGYPKADVEKLAEAAIAKATGQPHE